MPLAEAFLAGDHADKTEQECDKGCGPESIGK
jgi:hypothetical protein